MGFSVPVLDPKKLPYLQDFFDNPEKGQKEQAWKDAQAAYEGAQGTSDQRHSDTLAKTLAFFNPVQALMDKMYGKDPSRVNDFFGGVPPGGVRPYHGTAGTPYDGPPLPNPGGTTSPSQATWGAAPPPSSNSFTQAVLNAQKKK